MTEKDCYLTVALFAPTSTKRIVEIQLLHFSNSERDYMCMYVS